MHENQMVFVIIHHTARFSHPTANNKQNIKWEQGHEREANSEFSILFPRASASTIL